MWFKGISLILSAACLLEAALAALFRRPFERWLYRQFSAPTPTPTLRLLLVYLMTLTAAAWYAALFHYVRHGWIVTLLMTAVGLAVITMLTGWKGAGIILRASLEAADGVLGRAYVVTALLGAALLWLGLFVY